MYDRGEGLGDEMNHQRAKASEQSRAGVHLRKSGVGERFSCFVLRIFFFFQVRVSFYYTTQHRLAVKLGRIRAAGEIHTNDTLCRRRLIQSRCELREKVFSCGGDSTVMRCDMNCSTASRNDS